MYSFQNRQIQLRAPIQPGMASCSWPNLSLLLNLLLGFCGGSDPDSSHASQQPGWDSQWASAWLEGSCQYHLVTRTNVDCWILYLGTSQNISTVPFLWTQQPARLDNYWKTNWIIYVWPLMGADLYERRRMARSEVLNDLSKAKE